MDETRVFGTVAKEPHGTRGIKQPSPRQYGRRVLIRTLTQIFSRRSGSIWIDSTFTTAMETKSADISPDDKAIVERQIASALCYLYGGTVSEPLPDKVVALLEKFMTQEARRQRNLSEPHNDNETDDAFLIQRALGCALQLSFERVAQEPLSSEIAFLLMRLALAELVRSMNGESPPER